MLYYNMERKWKYSRHDGELIINRKIKIQETPYCEICFLEKELQYHHINGLQNGHDLSSLL